MRGQVGSGVREISLGQEAIREFIHAPRKKIGVGMWGGGSRSSIFSTNRLGIKRGRCVDFGRGWRKTRLTLQHFLGEGGRTAGYTAVNSVQSSGD